MLYSLGRYEIFLIFSVVALEEGSSGNYTGICTHCYIVESKHYCQGNVEDDKKGWCCVPVLFCNEDGEGDEDDECAADDTALSMPFFRRSSYAVVAEEADL